MSRRKNRVIFDSDSSENESSSSDLDSEFLNLAKKKNGKTETKKNAKQPKPKKIFAPVFSDTETSSGSDADWSYSNANKKKKKKKKKPKKVVKNKKVVKRRHNVDSDDDDEDEFVEAVTTKKKQPAKKKALHADLEEGEVEDSVTDDDSGEEFDDGYDEHLMGDDEDRERLAKMTEKEREQEIYKRIEAREVMKARFEIEKKLRKAKRQELRLQKKQQENNQDEKQLDLKERVQERKKMVEVNRGRADKKVHAMNLLKERREQKKEREEKEKQNKIEEEKNKEEQKNQRETDGKSSSIKRLRAADVYTDDSGSSSDEKKKRNNKIHRSKVGSSSFSSRSSSDSDSDSRSKRRRVQYIDSCEELNNIRLSRHKLERFVHLPIFRDIAVGCFVRVGLGTIRGDPIYRAGEIIDVCETAKIYQLGNTRTNKGLRVRHGSHERVFRLEFISNQEFTHNEFMRLKEYCLAKHVPMPTVDHMEKKMMEVKNAYYYEFKEEDVAQIVKEKCRFKILPYNFAMKKTQLIQDRENAQLRGDDDKAAEIQKQIVELEEKANELDKLRTSTISSISYINNRNRRKNVEEAEKAIMAEVQANKGQRNDDPFTRRHTKPSMIFRKPRPTPELEPAEAADTTDGSYPAAAKKDANKKFDPKDNDLFSAHNFDITIDFNEPLPNSFFTSLNSFRQQHEQQQLLQQQQQLRKKT